ncbi:MAG: hypothetical protein AB1634_16980 [Thermodesulfobacteriota bacterium]
MISACPRLVVVASLACCLVASGCASVLEPAPATQAPDAAAVDLPPENAPYYTEHNDIPIPNELSWDRDDSMSIRTASFAGGILAFSGRVEVSSLAKYFTGAMAKHGWQVAGQVTYQNILLAFTKPPNKTCMMSIFEPDFGMKTRVFIYVSEDLAGSGRTGAGLPGPALAPPLGGRVQEEPLPPGRGYR